MHWVLTALVLASIGGIGVIGVVGQSQPCSENDFPPCAVGCAAHPTADTFQAALLYAKAELNITQDLWLASVNPQGQVCRIVSTGLRSCSASGIGRIGAAELAFFANSISTSNVSLSTGNINALARMGGVDVAATQPPDPAVIYGGPVGNWGGENDPMIGKVPGGAPAIPGGLAVYGRYERECGCPPEQNFFGNTTNGCYASHKLGALAVASLGDVCLNHAAAWIIRDILELDWVPAGLKRGVNDTLNDNLIFDKENAVRDGFEAQSCGRNQSQCWVDCLSYWFPIGDVDPQDCPRECGGARPGNETTGNQTMGNETLSVDGCGFVCQCDPDQLDNCQCNITTDACYNFTCAGFDNCTNDEQQQTCSFDQGFEQCDCGNGNGLNQCDCASLNDTLQCLGANATGAIPRECDCSECASLCDSGGCQVACNCTCDGSPFGLPQEGCRVDCKCESDQLDSCTCSRVSGNCNNVTCADFGCSGDDCQFDQGISGCQCLDRVCICQDPAVCLGGQNATLGNDTIDDCSCSDCYKDCVGDVCWLVCDCTCGSRNTTAPPQQPALECGISCLCNATTFDNCTCNTTSECADLTCSGLSCGGPDAPPSANCTFDMGFTDCSCGNSGPCDCGDALACRARNNATSCDCSNCTRTCDDTGCVFDCTCVCPPDQGGGQGGGGQGGAGMPIVAPAVTASASTALLVGIAAGAGTLLAVAAAMTAQRRRTGAATGATLPGPTQPAPAA